MSPSGMRTPDLLLTVVGACPEVLFRFNDGTQMTLPKSVTSSTTESVRVVPWMLALNLDWAPPTTLSAREKFVTLFKRTVPENIL